MTLVVLLLKIASLPEALDSQLIKDTEMVITSNWSRRKKD
jgi:hypothetical protein